MTDKHPQGGNLFDMAKECTKVAKDAAKPNVIPPGPEPRQKAEGGPGGRGVADNALGSTPLGEVVSAAGGQLPEDVGQKYSRSGGKERGERQSAGYGGRNQP